MKKLFKQILDDEQNEGVQVELAFTLFDHKRKLNASLMNINKELAKKYSSNLKNAADWIVSVLEGYEDEYKN